MPRGFEGIVLSPDAVLLTDAAPTDRPLTRKRKAETIPDFGEQGINPMHWAATHLAHVSHPCRVRHQTDATFSLAENALTLSILVGHTLVPGLWTYAGGNRTQQTASHEHAGHSQHDTAQCVTSPSCSPRQMPAAAPYTEIPAQPDCQNWWTAYHSSGSLDCSAVMHRAFAKTPAQPTEPAGRCFRSDANAQHEPLLRHHTMLLTPKSCHGTFCQCLGILAWFTSCLCWC